MILGLLLAFQALGAQAGSPPSKARPVRHFFKTIEPFSESLPPSFSQRATILGKLVKVKIQPVCKQAPCPEVEQYRL